MPKVNPEILRWARTTAGLDVEDACRKLGINSARGVAAVDRLLAWENGDKEPTRALLEKMEKQYHRPLITFYLANLPKAAPRKEDYRVASADRHPVDEANLAALVREVRVRQDMARSALEEDDQAAVLKFVGSADTRTPVTHLMKQVTELIGFNLAAFRAAKSPQAAFADLRDLVEESGVFVLLASDLGSHHTGLTTHTFRGFALADPVVPFIVLNDQDSKSAWSFSLLHELSHVLLGTSGVSGGWSNVKIERLCDDVASATLLPTAELRRLSLPKRASSEDLRRIVSKLARDRNLSGTMFAYRLFRAAVITERQWLDLSSAFKALWEKRRAKSKEENKGSDGPSYYVVRRHRLGKRLRNLATEMLGAGVLTTTKAAQLLGVRPKSVHKLLELSK